MSWYSLSFQNSWSPLMAEASFFHDYVLTLLVAIVTLIVAVNIDLLSYKVALVNVGEQYALEMWWTILPAGLLLFVAYPSLRLLYLMDEVEPPQLSLSVVGHQWYWEYLLPDFNGLSYESYMDSSSDQPRLLDVDNRLCLPAGCLTRALVTSADVIHSWAIPSLGVKIDAVPGRVNQVSLMPLAPLLLYGQCSEICGINHSFMPIVLEILRLSDFIDWAENMM